MGFVELILTVCLSAQPDICEEKHLQVVSQGSLSQCTMGAPPHIAQWIGDHPKWTAIRWRCAYPGRDEKA
jgi:hypothetical protein